MKRIGMIVVAMLALASCKKKDDTAPAPTPVVQPGSGSAAGSGSAMGSGSAAVTTGSAAPAAKAVDVPTEQDFEKQAADKINDKNVEAQVKAIEQDLGQQK